MYLGLDIGTSGVKAVLVDDAQNIVDQATAPLTVNRPQALWSEQNPRSGELCKNCKGPPAQRLCPPPHDGRLCL